MQTYKITPHGWTSAHFIATKETRNFSNGTKTTFYKVVAKMTNSGENLGADSYKGVEYNPNELSTIEPIITPETKVISLIVCRSHFDSTNDGISSKNSTIYLVHPEGPTNFKDVAPQLVFTEEKRGPEYYALIPIIQPENAVGPMFGGNLAYSSDCRVKRPYHIHDRFETWEAYSGLSR
jgi:hypothetical protein